jgi:hypothetical protein
MRYRHKNTGAIYVSRQGEQVSDEPEVRVGWESQGIVDERVSVYSTRPDRNGGLLMQHAVWVSTSNLEQLDYEHEGKPEPDLFADQEREFQLKRRDWAFSLAETLTFNEGNALLAIMEGDLDQAISALVRERSRRYPAPTASTEETP